MSDLPESPNLKDPKDPFGKGIRQHLYGGFGPDHACFDANRYHSNTCQLCNRPCAIRCSECQSVLDGDAVACPTCGDFYQGDTSPEDGVVHRMGLAFCTFHALNEIEEN